MKHKKVAAMSLVLYFVFCIPITLYGASPVVIVCAMLAGGFFAISLLAALGMFKE